MGGTSRDFGTGNQNTSNIIANCTAAGIAAKIYSDLELNSYDWFCHPIMNWHLCMSI
jgi:hypothetical protein